MERLLDLFNDSSRIIWVLNNKYCPKQEMNEGGAIVVYTDKYVGEATPFSLDTIRDIDKFNYETFSLAYNNKYKNRIGCLQK